MVQGSSSMNHGSGIPISFARTMDLGFLLVNNLTATGSNQIEIKRKYILINTNLVNWWGQNLRLF